MSASLNDEAAELALREIRTRRCRAPAGQSLGSHH
jgi:hypothetical protein